MIEQLFDVDVESEKNTDQVPSFLLMNCLPHLTLVAKVQDAYQILEELRDPTIYDASSEDSWAAEGSRELVKRSKACNAAMKTVCCNKTGPFKSLRANHHAEKHELYLDFWPQKTESCRVVLVTPHFARGPNGDPMGAQWGPKNFSPMTRDPQDGLPHWAAGLLEGIEWSSDCPSYAEFLRKPDNKASKFTRSPGNPWEVHVASRWFQGGNPFGAFCG